MEGNDGKIGAAAGGSEWADLQAYCIASLLDIEAERLRGAVRLLTGCIEARKA